MVQSSGQYKELVVTVTVADLLDRLDGVSADRVRLFPIPGTATVQDVVDIQRREKRLCELVDGILALRELFGVLDDLDGGGPPVTPTA